MDFSIGSMRRKGKHWFGRYSEKLTDVEETGSCSSTFFFPFLHKHIDRPHSPGSLTGWRVGACDFILTDGIQAEIM